MAATLKLVAPAGVTGLIEGNATVYTISADRTVTVNANDAPALLALGFEPFATSATTVTPNNGGGQTNAAALASGINVITTTVGIAPPFDSVKLPASGSDWLTVVNASSNPIQVFGQGSDTINGVAASTGVTQATNSVEVYWSPATSQWFADLGAGFAGQLIAELSQVGIVAGNVSGTRNQSTATQLWAQTNRVDTSTPPVSGSTLGDGVKLMASAAGLEVTVINNTSNPIQVYPAGAETINGVAATTGVPIPPGDTAMFVCAAAGAWTFEAGMGSSGALPVELAASNIAAAGNAQSTATQLVAALNKVTSATAGTAYGVRLPLSAAGMDVIIENHSGVALQVYGGGMDTIDDVSTATGVVQMDSSVVIFTCYEPGKWYSNGLATGYAKNPQSGTVLETVQFADGLTATGTTQATALQLTAAINTASNVTAGTGVNLPASAPGLQVTIINAGANPLLVYPAQGASDTINGVAATTGVALFPGAAAQFNCTAAGAWTTQPATTREAAFNTNSATASTTLTAANITGGGASVDLALTGTLAAGATATFPTVAAMVVALHSPTVGTSFRLRIINQSSANFAWTVATSTGWTLAGSLGVNQNTWREFVVTLTSLTTATLQSVATGTYS